MSLVYRPGSEECLHVEHRQCQVRTQDYIHVQQDNGENQSVWAKELGKPVSPELGHHGVLAYILTILSLPPPSSVLSFPPSSLFLFSCSKVSHKVFGGNDLARSLRRSITSLPHRTCSTGPRSCLSSSGRSELGERGGGREGEREGGALLLLLFPRIVEDTPILYPKQEYYQSEHKEEPGPEPKPQDKPQPKSTGKSLQ